MDLDTTATVHTSGGGFITTIVSQLQALFVVTATLDPLGEEVIIGVGAGCGAALIVTFVILIICILVW